MKRLKKCRWIGNKDNTPLPYRSIFQFRLGINSQAGQIPNPLKRVKIILPNLVSSSLRQRIETKNRALKKKPGFEEVPGRIAEERVRWLKSIGRY
jgi:hypothetical protein